ncbi:MAG: O-antigen ligase family protein [Terracidiphilus sp.]
MGFFLSVVYLLTNYLTPPVLFGPVAQVHIEIVLAFLILLVSIPQITRSVAFKTPQTLALAGLSVSVFLSVLIATRWPGGAVRALLDFIPNIYAYFVLCLHCNSRKKLRVLVLMLLFVCLFVIAHGVMDLQRVGHSPPDAASPDGFNADTESDVSHRMRQRMWEIEHPYIFPMQDDNKNWFYRVRGLGEIHDPNDFGQILVSEIPLLFIFWKRKKWTRNLFFVILPAGTLLYGIYLTHSRGALLALLAVILFAARRRIGTLPAGVIAAVAFAGAMALHFTGGRSISAGAGAGREELWGESLQLVKSYPIFGIGMGQLPGYIGHTAHNSIVVCAAELGFVGLFFWCLFLLPTARNAFLIASPKKVSEAPDVDTQEDSFSLRAWKGTPLGKPEVNHWGFCLSLSLIGFFAAGFFLSRALVLSFFLLGGMTEVVYESAQHRGMVTPRLTLGRALKYSTVLMFVLLAVVYVMLRVLNMSR